MEQSRVVAVLLFQICPMGARRELMPKVMVSNRVLRAIIVREIRVKKEIIHQFSQKRSQIMAKWGVHKIFT